MMLKKTILAAAGILLCTQIAAASTYDQFIAFGDSTIDTGWFATTSTGISIFDGRLRLRSLRRGTLTLPDLGRIGHSLSPAPLA
jgi:hypothetical protein